MVMCICNCSEHGKLCHCCWGAHSHVATDMPERVARRSRLSEDQLAAIELKTLQSFSWKKSLLGDRAAHLKGPHRNSSHSRWHRMVSLARVMEGSYIEFKFSTI